MKSGWFWQTPMWQAYLQEYAKTRPECLHEWKSSPLSNDHDFTEYVDEPASIWEKEEHLSQVIDLQKYDIKNVRSSYRSIVNRSSLDHEFIEISEISVLKQVHREKFGIVRSDKTFDIQQVWLSNGNALVCAAIDSEVTEPRFFRAAILWIIYQECAYYASGPSLRRNVMHGLMHHSLTYLSIIGIKYVDMGQISGNEAGTRGVFKTGFGGEPKPFTIVRRK